MLDMGFIHDVRKIVSQCRRDRQTLLFSATMPPPIAKLGSDILDDPVRIDVLRPRSRWTASSSACIFVGAKEKRAAAGEPAQRTRRMDRVLVFTRTKRGADRVCRNLTQAGIARGASHGNKAQNARVRALDAFRNGKVRILVATDIAARGIDVPNISHVINYELPNEPESYVHRIGRTARAGAEGCGSVILRSDRASLSSGDRAFDAARRSALASIVLPSRRPAAAAQRRISRGRKARHLLPASGAGGKMARALPDFHAQRSRPPGASALIPSEEI